MNAHAYVCLFLFLVDGIVGTFVPTVVIRAATSDGLLGRPPNTALTSHQSKEKNKRMHARLLLLPRCLYTSLYMLVLVAADVIVHHVGGDGNLTLCREASLA